MKRISTLVALAAVTGLVALAAFASGSGDPGREAKTIRPRARSRASTSLTTHPRASPPAILRSSPSACPAPEGGSVR
jgi:hypothetical protein